MNPVMTNNFLTDVPQSVVSPQQEAETSGAFAETLNEKLAGGKAANEPKNKDKVETKDKANADEVSEKTEPTQSAEEEEKRMAQLLATLQGMLESGHTADGTPLTQMQLKQIHQMMEHLKQGTGDITHLKSTLLEIHPAIQPALGKTKATAQETKVGQTLEALAKPGAFASVNLQATQKHNASQAHDNASLPVEKGAVAIAPKERDRGKDANNVASVSQLEKGAAAAKPVEQSSKTAEYQEIITPSVRDVAATSSGNISPQVAGLARVTVDSSLGTQAWQQAINQHVSMFVREGISKAELHLHPAELGALKVDLRLNNDLAQLHFSSNHQQVRAAIEASLPHLRTSLAESGIQLGHSSVGAEGSSSSWQQSTSDQTHETDDEIQTSIIMNDEVQRLEQRAARAGGVDTFA